MLFRSWTPTTTLEELVSEMVAADRDEARKEAYLRLKGFPVVGSIEDTVGASPIYAAQTKTSKEN